MTITRPGVSQPSRVSRTALSLPAANAFACKTTCDLPGLPRALVLGGAGRSQQHMGSKAQYQAHKAGWKDTLEALWQAMFGISGSSQA